MMEYLETASVPELMIILFGFFGLVAWGLSLLPFINESYVRSPLPRRVDLTKVKQDIEDLTDL